MAHSTNINRHDLSQNLRRAPILVGPVANKRGSSPSRGARVMDAPI